MYMYDPVEFPFTPHSVYLMINMVKLAFLLKILLSIQESLFWQKYTSSILTIIITTLS